MSLSSWGRCKHQALLPEHHVLPQEVALGFPPAAVTVAAPTVVVAARSRHLRPQAFLFRLLSSQRPLISGATCRENYSTLSAILVAAPTRCGRRSLASSSTASILSGHLGTTMCAHPVPHGGYQVRKISPPVAVIQGRLPLARGRLPIMSYYYWRSYP